MTERLDARARFSIPNWARRIVRGHESKDDRGRLPQSIRMYGSVTPRWNRMALRAGHGMRNAAAFQVRLMRSDPNAFGAGRAVERARRRRIAILTMASRAVVG